MDIRKIKLLYYTLIHLKPIQVLYRLYYFIKPRVYKKQYNFVSPNKIDEFNWSNEILHKDSVIGNNAFKFLNLEKKFDVGLDWNFSEYGKLWTYNLNYFDFLNQESITKEEGTSFMDNYIRQYSESIDGKEPYPISLRLINWMKFIGKHQLFKKQYVDALYNDTVRLIDNREYHLLANHLLENGFALFFSAYFFKDEKIYRYAKNILVKELKEQVLEDGAHYELSPMYHQILLYRVLDCIHLAKSNPWKNDEVLKLLKTKANLMVSWLDNITFSNGNIPMLKDSTFGVAPNTNELLEYALKLNLPYKLEKLGKSDFRKFVGKHYEFVSHVGNIIPKYQPGHAHADMFTFEMYVKNNPFIVDTGISTYEKNKLRNNQRSTFSHNTVVVDNKNQSQVWGGFRVGRRAKVISFNEDETSLSVVHDGYKDSGTFHKRVFKTTDDSVIITDTLINRKDKQAVAYYHFHSDIVDFKVEGNSVITTKGVLVFKSENNVKIQVFDYQLSKGYNMTELSKGIKITFIRDLETSIII